MQNTLVFCFFEFFILFIQNVVVFLCTYLNIYIYIFLQTLRMLYDFWVFRRGTYDKTKWENGFSSSLPLNRVKGHFWLLVFVSLKKKKRSIILDRCDIKILFTL